jgi:ATP-dependent DNA helicase RecG
LKKRRLIQMFDQFHADELPTKAGIVELDKLRFHDFLRDVYKNNLLFVRKTGLDF